MSEKNVNEMMVEAVKLWKEYEVTNAVFNFSCGGDAMDETEWSIETENEGAKDELNQLEYLLNEMVYRKVTFYEISDGHYQGEFGTVEVTLDDDDTTLIFKKCATGEYTENFGKNITVEMTDEEAALVNKYISSFNGDAHNETRVIYKVDCLINEQEQVVLNNLYNRVSEVAEETEIDDEGLPDDAEYHGWFIFEMEGVEGKNLDIYVGKQFDVQRESE